MAPSQASRNQSQRCREQKAARPQPLLLPQREVAAAVAGARPSLGIVGMGVSLPGAHLPVPHPRQALLDIPGTTLTGSWVPTLAFFQVVILTLRHPSLPSWRISICSVPFLLSLFLYKNDNTLIGTIFPPETKVAQQVQFCWLICFWQGSMVTATPTPLRPDVMWVTSLQVSVSGS